jgi:very-short-patch-repair endonuclease
MPAGKKLLVTRGQPVDPEKVSFARAMRRNMTPTERVLWNRLRRSALEGLHFHRQQIIAGFIVDFYCAAASIAIELDGPVHDSQLESDRERDRALAELGIRTMRIRNEEVGDNLEAVLKRIAVACRRPNP